MFDKSIKAYEEAKCVIPGGVDSPVRAFSGVLGTPPFIQKGEGSYLVDIDGNRYLDFVQSWGPLIFGHCDKDIENVVLETVKNGLVRQKQRYKCKSCGHNFVCGDERRKKSTELKRITSVLLYSLGKASFRFLAKLFDVSPTTTYNWVRQTAESFGEPVVDENIKEIEIDEMWHFLQSKKTKNGLSRPWIVTQGELSPGLSVVVMLQRHEN